MGIANQNVTIYDSKSYGGLRTKSDYKLVMIKSLFKWKYSNTLKHRFRLIYELLHEKINANNTKQKQKNISRNNHSQEKSKKKWTNILTAITTAALQKQSFPKNIQKKWTDILTATKMAAEITLEIRLNKKHHVSKKINESSELQKMSNCNWIYQTTKMKEKNFV